MLTLILDAHGYHVGLIKIILFQHGVFICPRFFFPIKRLKFYDAVKYEPGIFILYSSYVRSTSEINM